MHNYEIMSIAQVAMCLEELEASQTTTPWVKNFKFGINAMSLSREISLAKAHLDLKKAKDRINIRRLLISVDIHKREYQEDYELITRLEKDIGQLEDMPRFTI